MRKFNIYVFSFFSEFSKNYQYLIYYLHHYRLLPPSHSKINFLFVYLHFIYNNCNSIAIITILWPLLQYHCKYLPSIINVCGTIGREMATLIGQTHFFADNIVTLGDQTISGLVFQVLRRSFLIFFFHVGHPFAKSEKKQSKFVNNVLIKINIIDMPQRFILDKNIKYCEMIN